MITLTVTKLLASCLYLAHRSHTTVLRAGIGELLIRRLDWTLEKSSELLNTSYEGKYEA